MKKKKPNQLHVVLFCIGIILIAGCSSFFILYRLFVIQPSNDRRWEVGFSVLPHFEKNGSLVTITGLRDFQYAPKKFVRENYVNRTVDVSKIKRVWFLVEPFEGIPVIDFRGIAHSYFIFDFEDSEPIAVSVEARREKDEKFNLVSGSLNQFELMYVWGTEKDITGVRVLKEDNSVYMYPLMISDDSARRLFLQLVDTSTNLETTPRFYNTFTSNCTNELAKNANAVKPDSVPYNIAWVFPGYAAADLYKLGFIPTNKPLEEITKLYYVSEIVKKYYSSETFSNDIRRELLKK